MVAAMHARRLILVPWGHLLSKNLLLNVFYVVTSFGNQAVMVFFVISGYLVGGLAVTRYSSRGFSLATFAVDRISRIYTVLVPALIVGGLLDWLGLRFCNASNIYTTSGHIPIVVADSLNIPTLLLNLANLQFIAGPRLGSNAPLWSLPFEWWYYVMFGAAMMAAIPGRPWLRLLSGATFVVVATWLPHYVILWGLTWLTGLAAAVYGQTRLWQPPVAVAGLLFAIALVISRIGRYATSESVVPQFGAPQFAQDMGVALGFAALILAFRRRDEPLPFSALHERLARFSYTLYLFHFPMLVFILAGLHDVIGLPIAGQPSVSRLAYLAAVVLFIVAYAWLVSLVFEARTRDVRDALLWLARSTFVRVNRPARPVRGDVSG